tara:strand:+ start:247 stop:546 length:300 start_codon:yes stop_codon:yes gene_type:complete
MSDKYEHNNGKGTLFKNSNKQQGDNKPEYKGDFKTPSGELLTISGWVATDRNTGEMRKDRHGNAFINLSIELPYEKPQPKVENPPTEEEPPKVDDDLPF